MNSVNGVHKVIAVHQVMERLASPAWIAKKRQADPGFQEILAGAIRKEAIKSMSNPECQCRYCKNTCCSTHDCKTNQCPDKDVCEAIRDCPTYQNDRR